MRCQTSRFTGKPARLLHPRAGGASGRAQPARPSPASCAARRLGRRAGRPHHRAGLAPRAGELLVGEQVWHEIERWAPRRGSRARACRSRAHPALLRIPHHAHRRPRASAGCGLPVVSAADVASRFPATARPEARYCSKRCRQAARCASAQAALRSHRPSAALAARAPMPAPGWAAQGALLLKALPAGRLARQARGRPRASSQPRSQRRHVTPTAQRDAPARASSEHPPRDTSRDTSNQATGRRPTPVSASARGSGGSWPHLRR